MMPKERARPSLLEPTNFVLRTLVSCSSTFMGKEKTDVMIGGIEKGIQDDIDEQLRMLNDKQIEDKELRQMIIKIRDNSYDLMEESGKLERVRKATEDSKS